ncbi:hypothetical protein C4K04_4451 [Pseudomonas chlororaphis]|uniref:Uncharacterized protein n=1 Tax=Pseudomonas chlororaphis TaxID=587753 RepID=A0A3G7TSQ8_9PSED|nr:hypothetical protein C4K04_4451 [Pseudomonas chlororaphis]
MDNRKEHKNREFIWQIAARRSAYSRLKSRTGCCQRPVLPADEWK